MRRAVSVAGRDITSGTTPSSCVLHDALLSVGYLWDYRSVRIRSIGAELMARVTVATVVPPRFPGRSNHRYVRVGIKTVTRSTQKIRPAQTFCIGTRKSHPHHPARTPHLIQAVESRVSSAHSWPLGNLGNNVTQACDQPSTRANEQSGGVRFPPDCLDPLVVPPRLRGSAEAQGELTNRHSSCRNTLFA